MVEYRCLFLKCLVVCHSSTDLNEINLRSISLFIDLSQSDYDGWSIRRRLHVQMHCEMTLIFHQQKPTQLMEVLPITLNPFESSGRYSIISSTSSVVHQLSSVVHQLTVLSNTIQSFYSSRHPSFKELKGFYFPIPCS